MEKGLLYLGSQAQLLTQQSVELVLGYGCSHQSLVEKPYPQYPQPNYHQNAEGNC